MLVNARVLFLLLLLATPCRSDDVALLERPEDLLRASMEMIENAHGQLVESDFVFRDDHFGRMKLAAMIDLARRGGRPRLLVDSLHLMADPAVVKAALDQGVQIRVFNPPARTDLTRRGIRLHAKGMATDTLLKTGGTNSSNEYVGFPGPQMRDRDVLIQGGAAPGDFTSFHQQIWNSPWAAEPGIAVAPDAEVAAQVARKRKSQARVQSLLRLTGIDQHAPDLGNNWSNIKISASQLEQARKSLDEAREQWQALKIQRGWEKPASWFESGYPGAEVTYFHDGVTPRTIEHRASQAVFAEISRAKQSAQLTSPYMVLTPEGKRAFSQAVRNGVEAELITNSEQSGNNRLTQDAYELRLHELAATGIRLYEYQTPGENFHPKTAVLDGMTSVVSSVNFDPLSENINVEAGVVIRHAGLAERMSEVFASDQRQSVPVAAGGQVLREPRKMGCFRRLVLTLLESRL